MEQKVLQGIHSYNGIWWRRNALRVPRYFALHFLLFTFYFTTPTCAQQTAPPLWIAPFGLSDAPEYVAHEANATLLCWEPGVIKGDKRWKMMLLDANLSKKWDGLFEINIRYELKYSLEEVDGKGMWLFFNSTSDNMDCYFLYVNYATGNSESIQLRLPIAVEPELMLRTPEGMYLKASYDAEPIVLYCNLEERRTQVLPKVYKRRFNICGMAVDPSGTQLWLLSKGEVGRHTESTFQVFEQSQEVSRQPVRVPKDLELGAAFPVFGSNQVQLTGTLLAEETDHSQGTFICTLSTLGPVTIEQFVPFKEQEGFYAHLGLRRAEKLRDKDQRRRSKPLRGRYYHHAPQRVGPDLNLLMEHYYFRDPQPITGPFGRGPYMPGEFVHDYLLISRYDTAGRLAPITSLALPNLLTFQIKGSVSQTANGQVWYLQKGTLFTTASQGELVWLEQDAQKLGLGEVKILTITQKLDDATGSFIIWGELETAARQRKFFMARVR